MPRPLHTLLGALTLAGIILASAVLRADDARENTAIKPAPREKAWLKRHESFLNRAQSGPIDVLFIGDSITQGWEGKGKAVWAEKYEPLKAANFGIGGDRTQHVLWRLIDGKELEGIQPKVAVVMIGTNNMGASSPSKDGQVGKTGNTAPEIAAGVKAIVDEIRKKLPKTKILLLAIFPRGDKPDSPIRAKVAEVNRTLADMDDGGKTVLFLDIGPKFLTSDGVLTAEIMPDSLHLSEKGYQIWADAIDKPLKKLMK